MKKWIDWALAWVREASSPAGLSGVIAGLLLVVVTDGLLLGMRYIQELPPVAVTFLLSILIAAIRWGFLAGAVTSIGGRHLAHAVLLQPVLYLQRPGSLALPRYSVLPHRRPGDELSRGPHPPRCRRSGQAGKRNSRPLYVLATALGRELAGRHFRSHAAPSRNPGRPQGAAVRFPRHAGSEVRTARQCRHSQGGDRFGRARPRGGLRGRARHRGR